VDATGASVYWNVSIVVSASVTPHIDASVTVADVGLNVSFTASSSGGSGSPTYGWNFGDGVQGAGYLVTHAYSQPGVYTVALTATDSLGGRGVTSVTVDVFPALAVTLAPVNLADLGVPTSLAAKVDGGAPPMTYSWIVDDGGHGTNSALDHTFTTAGSHTIQLTVQDSANVSQVVHAVVRVATAITVTIPGPSQLSSGVTGSWLASVSGGTAPYRLTWSFSDGENGSGSNASITPASSGTYRLQFRATDPLNGSGSTLLNVSVASPPSLFGGNVDGIPTADLVVVVVAVVAVAVAAGFVMSRRRRTRKDGPGEG
jgi:PKD repeat protein